MPRGRIWHGPGTSTNIGGKPYVEVRRAHGKLGAQKTARAIRANGGTARVRFWGVVGGHDIYQVLQGPPRKR